MVSASAHVAGHEEIEVAMTRMSHRAPFAGRHARAGAAFLAVAVILAATSVSVGLAIPDLASSAWRAVLTIAIDVLRIAAVWVALPVGTYLIVTSGEPRLRRRVIAIVAAVALPVVVELTGVARSPFLILLALAAAVGGYAVIVLGLTEHRRDPIRLAAVATAVTILTAANLAMIALGTMHLLVWNPLAKVPELEWPEIVAALDSRGGLDGGPLAWTIGGTFLTLAAAAGAIIGARRGKVTPHQVVTGGLLLIHGVSFFLWWAGFGLGLELADTFGVGGGDASPAGSVIALVGAMCLAAAILLQLRPPAAGAGADADEVTEVDADARDGANALGSADAGDGPIPVTPATVTP
jgi:hypothetical protein